MKLALMAVGHKPPKSKVSDIKTKTEIDDIVDVGIWTIFQLQKLKKVILGAFWIGLINLIKT